jgi:hypothetical protein
MLCKITPPSHPHAAAYSLFPWSTKKKEHCLLPENRNEIPRHAAYDFWGDASNPGDGATMPNVSFGSCTAHFDELHTSLGIRHPLDVLPHSPPLPCDDLDLLIKSAGGAVWFFSGGHLHVWHGLITTAHSKARADVQHSLQRVSLMLQLLGRLPTSKSLEFVAAFDSQDTIFADHPPGAFAKVSLQRTPPCTMADSLPPSATGVRLDKVDPMAAKRHSTLLLPALAAQDASYPGGANRVLAEALVAKTHDGRCFWQGSDSGFAKIQSTYSLGRQRLCLANETDRRCLARLAAFPPLNTSLNFQLTEVRGNHKREEGRGGWGAGFDASITSKLCMLSVDGNSFASNFAYGILRGQTILRVGGAAVSAATGSSSGRGDSMLDPRGAQLRVRRVSSYQWFEPLLVEGEHYLRTDLDDISDKLRTLPPPAKLRRIAAAGRRAAAQLFSRHSVLCYNVLAITRFAAAQQELVAKARARGAQTWRRVEPDPSPTVRDLVCHSDVPPG